MLDNLEWKLFLFRRKLMLKKLAKRMWDFVTGLFGKRVQVFEVPARSVEWEKDYKPTKAYFDQRQKAPHNRRRKPSKAMKNLYHLKNF